MVPTRPVLSKTSSPFVTIPCAPITIGITVIFIFHSCCFFQFHSKVQVLILLFDSFNFPMWSAETAKSTILQIFFFFLLLIIIRSGDPLIFQNPRGVCASHSPGQMLGCAYTICSYGQVSFSCKVLSGSLCPPSRVLSYTLSLLICCIRLYYRFVSITIWSTFAVLLRHIYSCFDMVGPYGVVSCCY